MARAVADVAALQEYLTGVMDRADHHADEVSEVVLALVGGVVWRKDADPIRVMTRDGEMKNVLWVYIGGVKYVFSYNHEAGSIELRRDSTQGRVLHAFDNSTALAEVKRVFRSL